MTKINLKIMLGKRLIDNSVLAGIGDSLVVVGVMKLYKMQKASPNPFSEANH